MTSAYLTRLACVSTERITSSDFNELPSKQCRGVAKTCEDEAKLSYLSYGVCLAPYI